MPRKRSAKNPDKKDAPPTDLQQLSMYIAMVVRNTMEDFHWKYLSDEQMKELNPTIRNAIFTALYAFEKSDEQEGARRFVDFAWGMIPDYWEDPVLTDDFLKSMEYFERGSKERPSNKESNEESNEMKDS